MIKLRATVQYIAPIGVCVLICIGALSACKTTDYSTEKEVDIRETHIILPPIEPLNERFKIKRTIVASEASWVMEKVYFAMGSYAYERYFHGGFYAASKESLLNVIAKYFAGFEVIKDPGVVSGQMGDVYFSTAFNAQDNLTCVIGFGNYGATILFRVGSGYTGRTMVESCDKGRRLDLDQEVLPWLKKIRLRS